MTPKTVDLRSDFLSPWTREVVAAMTQAAATPFEFELRGDTRQQEVERRVAALLGRRTRSSSRPARWPTRSG